MIENLTEFKNAKCILCFWSLPDEISTHNFIKKWNNDKQFILPVIANDNLELRVFAGTKNMEKGSYNILEPINEDFTNFDSIDFAIIPGLGFDKFGNRLGRGKGFYDKLLPNINCTKYGICFPCQIIDNLPQEPWDVSMEIGRAHV